MESKNITETLAGEKLCFIVESMDRPPSRYDNMACAIAFVPGEGFQWAKYFNGSKTWKSIVTGNTITPTCWLRKM